MSTKKMTWEEIETHVNSQIAVADDYMTQLSSSRLRRWDRYYGRKLGNERNGRSKYIARDLLEIVEWALPKILRDFASGDPKVKIVVEGQDDIIGKALTTKIHEDLVANDPPYFVLAYNWFKDSMVTDVGTVKPTWVYDYEEEQQEFPFITDDQWAQLQRNPDVKLKSYQTQIAPQPIGVFFTNVRANVRRTMEDRLVVENVPFWELLVHPSAKTMNDEWGKGQATKVTLDYLRRVNRAYSEPGKPFFKDLDQFDDTDLGAVINDAPGSSISSSDSQRTAYFERDLAQDESKDSSRVGAGRILDLTEWYDRLDIDGDGFLEHITSWVVGGKLIRYEENEERFIPFSSLSPVLNPYTLVGMSWAELLEPIQNLRTMIIRRGLDGYDFSVNGFWGYDPNGNVDIQALLEGVPGDAIKAGSKDAVWPMMPGNFNFQATLAWLQWTDQERETRIGQTKYQQGQDAKGLNQTAHGIELITRQAQQRMDLISLLFAYTGVSDLFKKSAWLYQRYKRQPFTVKVDGTDVTISPEQLQGKVAIKVDMGIDEMVGQRETQKLGAVTSFLMGLSQRFPGLVGPDQIHSIAARFVGAMGYEKIDDFVAQKEACMQFFQQALQGQQQAGMAKMQLDGEKFKTEAQLRMADQKLKAAELERKSQIEASKLQADIDKAKADIGMKERDSRRDFKVDMLRSIADVEENEWNRDFNMLQAQTAAIKEKENNGSQGSNRGTGSGQNNSSTVPGSTYWGPQVPQRQVTPQGPEVVPGRGGGGISGMPVQGGNLPRGLEWLQG